MELFKRKKKMVAAAYHNSAAIIQSADYLQRLGDSAFHLHPVLEFKLTGHGVFEC
jgi:hypothetical protein